MPTLTWIGKDKVVNHHHDVPYRVLEHKYGFRAKDNRNIHQITNKRFSAIGHCKSSEIALSL